MKKSSLGAASVALLAACSDLNVPLGEEINYAIFNVVGRDSGTPGRVLVEPSGFFFRSFEVNLPSSRTDENACFSQRIPADGAPPRFISPGDSIGFSAGGVTEYLQPTPVGDITEYRLRPPGRMETDPGAQLTFTVLGSSSGFPASDISGKSAEPLTVDSIPLEIVPGEPGIHVTWSPATNDPDVKIVLTLQYRSPDAGAGDQPTDQILCSFRDDGSEFIPQGLSTNYINATDGIRVNSVVRLRTTAKDVGGSMLLILARYEAVAENAPAPPVEPA
ncbi:MAG: hypothetical protein M3373_08330 [Gemmatimonadota bacterium]|nr:hypothetical protein [Gemmatimonadota bacterium]